MPNCHPLERRASWKARTRAFIARPYCHGHSRSACALGQLDPVIGYPATSNGRSVWVVGGGCLDESVIVAFLGGTLATNARVDAEAHLATCSACADLVTWAAADLTAAASPGTKATHSSVS